MTHPDPSPCVEHVFGNVLHREFPMHVAKIREWKRRNTGVSGEGATVPHDPAKYQRSRSARKGGVDRREMTI